MLLFGRPLFEDEEAAAATVKELPSRESVDIRYKWNLEDIYASPDGWEEDYKWVEDELPGYVSFKGHLSKSCKIFLEALKFDDSIGIKLSRLYLYAMLSKDLDLSDSAARGRHDRINSLYSRVMAAGSFLQPEIISLPPDKIESYFAESADLRVYRHRIDDLTRKKQHTLSAEVEEVLAGNVEINHIPYGAFSVFTDAELQFPAVKDPEGREVKISHGRYSAALYSTDREFRKRVYKGFYGPFMEYKNTLSVLFSGVIKTHVVNSRIRKYSSSRAAALNENNIPEHVYDSLVKNVNENLQPLHRWAGIRKRVLGLDELHPYDLYVTLFPGVARTYDFEEGKKIVSESLKPVGNEYIENVQKAFDNRWVDVFETKGKRSGAYSSGTTYGIHPYVLLNWNGQLNDVFTLAHEMGHNMHSYYTLQNQPYPYADYSIFLAEVASTANEALLLDYLIVRAESREEKMSLIEKYLTNITTTFYRQTYFAEYEQRVHEMAENSEPLMPDVLCGMYRDLIARYWGPELVIDDEESYTWARVPHFYYNFYVYQYATGYSASQALVSAIKSEGQPAVDRYLEFLKAGNSDYAINVLKKAGIDMTSPEPVKHTIRKMNELLDQLEELLEQ